MDLVHWLKKKIFKKNTEELPSAWMYDEVRSVISISLIIALLILAKTYENYKGDIQTTLSDFDEC